MANVLSISGSPSATSRTTALLRHLDTRLIAQGHRVTPLEVRSMPAEALLGADLQHPAIVARRHSSRRPTESSSAHPSTRPPTPGC